MVKIERLLISLASEGKINEIQGEQLYALLKKISSYIM